ncbi:hypothetical protein E0H75_29620 [Kribbella capetownensis]|uniref:Lipoprotein n=1 Tax=Kribbella capetownensis TaxID=1572659 RepID=A0A4R0JFX3_9ACTN|nr:hypothetical protein [Kribbella capetownensis]TCC45873.1 hypothetical protein E0H75_29620 [Kribbella capetownensis]
MISTITSARKVAFALVLVCGLSLLTSCKDDDADASTPAPVAGIVEGSDLPGSPRQEKLDEDGIPLNGCHLDGSMSLQERADHKQSVKYTLGDTEVSSYLYTYTNTRKLKQDWDFLVNGQKRCVGTGEKEPQGSYSLLTDLPADTTGYDAIHRSDNQVVHTQRAWARKGDGTVVSVMVTRTVDKAGAEQSPSLPVDAKALTVKAAAE